MEALIQEVRRNLEQGRYKNEAAVRENIVREIIKALGWPVSDPTIVYPEFPLQSLKPDYALCPNGDDMPVVIVEVKAVGKLADADKQLFEYTFHAGAGLAVLTDGKEWQFYLPFTIGRYLDKRFYTIDLMYQNVHEIEARFNRYLSFTNVKSRKFLAHAEEDLEEIRRKNEAMKFIPGAFKELVDAGDMELLKIIGDRVAVKEGIMPETNHIQDYLKSLIEQIGGENNSGGRVAQPPLPPNERGRIKYKLRIEGFEVTGKNPTELFINALELISSRYPQKIPVFHNGLRASSRKVISKNKYELFPKQGSDFIEKYARFIDSTEFWVDINNSTEMKRKYLIQIIKLIGPANYELNL